MKSGLLFGESVEPIERRFVTLAFKYRETFKETKPSEEEISIILEILSAARFNPRAMVPGILKGDYMDQGGRTGETFPINTFPFKILNLEGEEDYHATGWLDTVFLRVVHGDLTHSVARVLGTEKEESFDELVEAVRVEIERSIPLEPIQLTKDGEILLEFPPEVTSRNWLVNHTRDHDELAKSRVGIHGYCGARLNRNRVTEVSDALHCNDCGLRILIPKEIKTYGELRQHLKSALIQRSDKIRV